MLLAAFDSWISSNMRTTLETLTDRENIDAETITDALVAYGKGMYQAGLNPTVDTVRQSML